MAGLPSRRIALATLLIAAALAALATAIIWQTSSAVPQHGPGPKSERESEREPGPESESESESESEHEASPPSPPPSGSAPSAPPPIPSEPAVAAEVRALVAAGQIGKARSRADEYFELFPGGPATAELQRLTGAHPRR